MDIYLVLTKNLMKMKIKTPKFDFIEKKIREKTFGIFTSITKEGKPHSTGILYAVSPPKKKFCLYILTMKKYKKVENVQNDPNVAFVIPFPHHILRFVPASCIQFQGIGEILPIDDSEAIEAFIGGKKILRMNFEQLANLKDQGEAVSIKIKPNKRINVYGVGISMMKMRKDVSIGSYSVEIPNNRI